MELLNELPEFVRALPGDEVPEGAVRWSGKADPPAVGERFNVRVNGIGPAVAVGYYVDSGWLGVMCDVEKWPPHFAKQNGDNMRCGVFGAEL